MDVVDRLCQLMFYSAYSLQVAALALFLRGFGSTFVSSKAVRSSYHFPGAGPPQTMGTPEHIDSMVRLQSRRLRTSNPTIYRLDRFCSKTAPSTTTVTTSCKSWAQLQWPQGLGAQDQIDRGLGVNMASPIGSQPPTKPHSKVENKHHLGAYMGLHRPLRPLWTCLGGLGDPWPWPFLCSFLRHHARAIGLALDRLMVPRCPRATTAHLPEATRVICVWYVSNLEYPKTENCGFAT